jgi:capsular polysaccharide transport system permease protein
LTEAYVVPSLLGALAAQVRVLKALMIRDLSSRFFGSKFGNLISIGWVLSHILLVLLINAAAGRLTPYGDSALLWTATGVVPFLSFSYMSRFTVLGIIVNRPLLSYPNVKFIDLMVSRAVIEVLNTGVVILLVSPIFLAADVSIVPRDIVGAATALAGAMLLGFGAGIANSVIAGMVPMWSAGYSLFTVLLWITSGIFFVPAAFPGWVQHLMSYNPTTQFIELMRAAYYEGYGMRDMSAPYLFWFGAALLASGLCMERMVRGRILQG